MKKVFPFLAVIVYTTGTCQILSQKGTGIFGAGVINYSILNYPYNGPWQQEETTTYSTPDTTIVTVVTNKSTKSTNSGEKNSGISIGIYPQVAYFIKNGFCTGVGFAVRGNGVSSELYLPTTLFIRYYFRQKKKCFSFSGEESTSRFAFFMQATMNGGYGINKNEIPASTNNNNTYSKTQTTSYAYGINMGLGSTYLLSNHIAIEGLLFYYNINLGYRTIGNTMKTAINSQGQTESWSTETNRKILTNNSGLNLLLGIQTYF